MKMMIMMMTVTMKMMIMVMMVMMILKMNIKMMMMIKMIIMIMTMIMMAINRPNDNDDDDDDMMMMMMIERALYPLYSQSLLFYVNSKNLISSTIMMVIEGASLFRPPFPQPCLKRSNPAGKIEKETGSSLFQIILPYSS